MVMPSVIERACENTYSLLAEVADKFKIISSVNERVKSFAAQSFEIERTQIQGFRPDVLLVEAELAGPDNALLTANYGIVIHGDSAIIVQDKKATTPKKLEDLGIVVKREGDELSVKRMKLAQARFLEDGGMEVSLSGPEVVVEEIRSKPFSEFTNVDTSFGKLLEFSGNGNCILASLRVSVLGGKGVEAESSFLHRKPVNTVVKQGVVDKISYMQELVEWGRKWQLFAEMIESSNEG